MPDWTVPFDDALVRRYQNCIFCAQPADRVELFSAANDFAMTIGVCGTCVKADVSEARRQAVVAQHALKQPPHQTASHLTPAPAQPGARWPAPQRLPDQRG